MNTLELQSPQSGQFDQPHVVKVREIRSDELFKASQEILIHHGGQEYRLRITRQNRLILTK